MISDNTDGDNSCKWLINGGFGKWGDPPQIIQSSLDPDLVLKPWWRLGIPKKPRMVPFFEANPANCWLQSKLNVSESGFQPCHSENRWSGHSMPPLQAVMLQSLNVMVSIPWKRCLNKTRSLQTPGSPTLKQHIQTIWYTYHQRMNENTGYTQWFWL